jgi:AraC-like DNA-binding protein/mannose-6-phosphate isomerase-like protein (cupin superfamily)
VRRMNDIPWYIQSQNSLDLNSTFHVRHHILNKYFPPHRHDFIEIEFISSGEGTEIINGVEYQLKIGSIIILLPWHIHEVIPDTKNPLEIFKCSFGAELFLDNNSPFFELSDLVFKNTGLQPMAYLGSLDCEKVHSFFNELLAEYAEMKLWKETLIKAKISEILIYFDRCRQSTYPFDDTALHPQNKFSIWKVIEYIHSSFDRDITIQEISNKFHYSGSYINKLLRQYIGLNFDALLQEVRVRNACAMLSYPSISINEIALGVGYKSKEIFCRSFKNVKGISPENYRKLYLAPKNCDSKFTTRSVLSSQIIYYLHLHFNEEVTLTSVAQNFHYNENYLSDILMQNDLSFISLLHEIRIYHACTLLLTTETPINEIGFNVGFDSAETFFRVFKKLRGTTPGEYRKCEGNEHHG